MLGTPRSCGWNECQDLLREQASSVARGYLLAWVAFLVSIATSKKCDRSGRRE